ncbi:MAG: CPBP family intramembrane metalloprotease [Lentisphaeraceae bacterium]|nr:CPBP family intramembrane metalloprotease [Lentisphaeraceae bacterium]
MFKKIIDGLRPRALEIIVLNLGVLCITVLAFFLLGGDAFRPYVREVAVHILTVKDFSIYLLSLAVYGFFLELFLRRVVQDKLLAAEKKGIKFLALIVPLLINILIHSRFGLIGYIYSFVIGAFLSIYYLKSKDWLTFSIWHMCWGFIIVPLTMAACVFMDGSIRDDFLFEYKKRHILKGKMYYQSGWGWVDKVHYRPDHFEHFMKALESGGEKVEMTESWVTPLKIPVSFTCAYEMVRADNELENWAIVTGMMLDFMRMNETVQLESPWYHGNQLSAWQFDDMSSALFCSLQYLPKDKRLVFGEEVFDQEKLMAIWVEEGESLITQKVKEEESWALLDEAKRKVYQDLVKKMKSNWRRTSFERKN